MSVGDGLWFRLDGIGEGKLNLAETQYGKFYYFQRDSIGQAIAKGGFFGEPLKPYFDRLNKDSVLVDVGANIGFFTIYAALCRGAQVIAFEASPEVFALLELNVTVSGIKDKVVLWNVALYDGTRRLKINPVWYEGSPKLPDGRMDYENIPNSGGLSLVPSNGKDSFAIGQPLDDFGIQKIDLLKVDTQQADLRVLVGARRTIERCRPTICFEWEHPEGEKRNASGDSLEDFFRFFDSLGYKVQELGGVDYVAEAS